MALAVTLLVVVSALVHAVWNALLKRSRDPEHAVVGTITVCAASSCALALALRVQLPPRAGIVWCVVAGLFEAGYVLTLAKALARAPLGPVYTIVRGGALVVVWPISLAVLGEPLTPLRLLGTTLVGLGLAATGAGERTVVPAERPGRRATGFFFATVCAAFVGGYHLAYKVALSSGGRAESVVAISTSTAAFLVLVTLGRKRRARALEAMRAQPLLLVLTGVLSAASFVIFLLAMSRAGAGVVLTLRNTSILFAQIFALALGEKFRLLGILGAFLVTAGAVLLAR